MILSSSQIAGIRQRTEREVTLGAKSAHGYPKDTIMDLLQTIDDLRAKKKQWQHVAEHRGEIMGKITKLAVLSRVEEEVLNES